MILRLFSKSCIAFMICVLSGMAIAQETLEASVDRRTVGVNETLTLTLQYNGNAQRGGVKFDALAKDFTIRSQKSGNKIYSDMNTVRAVTEWTLVLSPNREGKLRIPSFSLGSLISSPIDITVQAAQAPPPGTLQDIFLETEVSADEVFVQQEILLTYRLFYNKDIRSLETEPLEIENVLQEQLPDARFNRRIDGTQYGIAEFHYAIYPQNSGELVIPALRWEINVPENSRGSNTYFGLGGRYSIKNLTTESKTINVLPKPQNFPGKSAWAPARGVVLEESWSQDPENFKTGEPLTRTLTLRAEGLMASQLPRVAESEDLGAIKVYTDQPELSDDKRDSGIISTRIESAAIVINKSGNVTLPPVRVPWWDTVSDTLRYAEIPARTVLVQGGAGTSDERPPILGDREIPAGTLERNLDASAEAIDEMESELLIWRSVSAFLGLGIVALLGLVSFMLRRRKTPTAVTATPPETLKLENACRSNDPKQIRKALLKWASERFTPKRIYTLDTLAARLNRTELTRLLKTVDAALFSENSSSAIKGEDILKEIRAFEREDRQRHADAALAPLYPT